MIGFHQVDPGWYDRYWYSDHLPSPHLSKPGRLLPGRAFRLLIRRVRAIYTGPQSSDFELWHSPLR